MQPTKPNRNLFPSFDEQPNYGARRNYVMRRLLELIDSGEFFLTDCFSQGPKKRGGEPIRSIIGDCILGYKLERGTQRAATRPRELLLATVRLRAIPRLVQIDTDMPDGSVQSRMEEQTTPIRFQVAAREVDDEWTYDTAVRSGMSRWADGGAEYEENWIETDELEVDVPLEQAWWALKANGKNVRRAPGKRHQRMLWHFEEVHPSEYATKSEPPKRKPGRPRKTDEARA